MTNALYRQRIRCMHFGVVRVWMRYGNVTDGTLGKGKYLLILRNYADGWLRMGSQWNFLLSWYGVYGIREIKLG